MTTAKNPPRMFYKSNDELTRIQENLKLTQCPHCGQYGTLILNGTAKGYVEGDDFPVIRRRRIVCNARRKSNKGCGSSISVFKADFIPRLRIFCTTLLLFAAFIAKGFSANKAFRKLNIDLHRRAASRWRNRLINAMSLWRNNRDELFYFQETRKVKKDNTFSFRNCRYEAPSMLCGKEVTIRFSRIDSYEPVIVYYNHERQGKAQKIDFIHNAVSRRHELSEEQNIQHRKVFSTDSAATGDGAK